MACVRTAEVDSKEKDGLDFWPEVGDRFVEVECAEHFLRRFLAFCHHFRESKQRDCSFSRNLRETRLSN
ncbi:hypothetical protein L1049_007986 [Liquidambar formosana]|uniref:Uncharacterized protein n=1 Tax=Liquidambar formosana TaxID=63359 RepID=A0AAP0X497_LIQFO